mgnify:FL=1
MNEINPKNKLTLRSRVSRLRTIPVFFPAFIAGLLIVLNILVRGGNLSKESTFGDLCILLSLFLFSLSGVLVIIRKEVPRLGLPSIKGWVAVVEGVFFVIITTIAMLVFLVELIR